MKINFDKLESLACLKQSAEQRKKLEPIINNVIDMLTTLPIANKVLERKEVEEFPFRSENSTINFDINSGINISDGYFLAPKTIKD